MAASTPTPATPATLAIVKGRIIEAFATGDGDRIPFENGDGFWFQPRQFLGDRWEDPTIRLFQKDANSEWVMQFSIDGPITETLYVFGDDILHLDVGNVLKSFAERQFAAHVDGGGATYSRSVL